MTILHVDMDAFYASVEVLADPSLRGKPVIVGGSSDRGVVASCNYEARVYGISSAMPSSRAKRLCPHAVFLPGRYAEYARVSRQIHQVFREFTPLVEGIALDEAFLDVTGAHRLFGSGEDIGHAIRARVREETGLSCSVGVAPVKLLAKLASVAAKPRATRRAIEPGRGVVVVAPGEELDFLHPLPVRALWGVGPATHRRLERFGVHTVGDLAALPLETLVGALGNGQGRHLHDLAWARDPRHVVADGGMKSIGHEETYPRDLHDDGELRREIVKLADSVAARLRAAKLTGRTVTLKVRFHDFATITRSHTFPTPVDTAPHIAATASELLASVETSPGVRLLGITMSNLHEEGSVQLTLEEAAQSGAWHTASEAVDAIRARFGESAVGPAALLRNGKLKVKRQGDQQWGPS